MYQARGLDLCPNNLFLRTSIAAAIEPSRRQLPRIKTKTDRQTVNPVACVQDQGFFLLGVIAFQHLRHVLSTEGASIWYLARPQALQGRAEGTLEAHRTAPAIESTWARSPGQAPENGSRGLFHGPETASSGSKRSSTSLGAIDWAIDQNRPESDDLFPLTPVHLARLLKPQSHLHHYLFQESSR